MSETSPITSTELSPSELDRLNSLAEEIPIDSITIGERIRRDFSHVDELAKSIAENGLIQPIVITHNRTLVAGESRIRAHKLLGRTHIRAVFIGVLDEAHLHILECEENNARKALTWQERCLSVDRVHRYKSTQAVLRGQKWGVRETGALLKQSKTNTGLAVLVAEALHANNEEVWKAESLQEALRVLLLQKEQAALKLVVAPNTTKPTRLNNTAIAGTPPVTPKPVTVPDVDFFSAAETVLFTPGITGPAPTDEMPGQPAAPLVIPLSEMLFKEPDHNSLTVLESFGPDCCDHIITDPPYAIDMANLQQDQGGQDVSTVLKEHDVAQNVTLLHAFTVAAYNAIRDRGFLVMWCDPTMWMSLFAMCESAGFTVQRWPLVWHKTSACSNQSASTNFTKNVEFAVVARKGKATLLAQQPSCVWTGGNDMETRLLGHPFVKPAALWEWLYRAICQRGQTVIEPFAGVGSAVLPAIKHGLNVRAIECNDLHFGRLHVNVQNLYKSIDPKVTFS